MTNNWQSSWDKPPLAKAIEEVAAAITLPSLDDMTEDQLLMKHKELQEKIASLKEEEMTLRKHIVARAFPKPVEGVNKRELGEGYTLKATVKYNYVLDKDNNKIDAMLEAMSKIDNEGSFVADRLVNWKPTLSVSEYRKLEPKYKKIADEVITMNDAAPTLEIIEPKK